MKRRLMLALFALPLVAALSGCVFYEEGGGYYHHHHYWRDR